MEMVGRPFFDIKEAFNDFSMEECDLISKLRDAAPKFEIMMARTQKEILEYRALKKILLRKLKNERVKDPVSNACVIVREPPSPLRILPPSPLSLHHPRADIAPEPSQCGRSETHPDPDAVSEGPRDEGWSAPEVIDIADSSDAGGVSDDEMAFKRGPRRSSSCKTLTQVTRITRIVESRSDSGYFVQRDEALTVLSVSLPNIPPPPGN